MHAFIQNHVLVADLTNDIRSIFRQIYRKQIYEIFAFSVRVESEQENIEFTIANKIDTLIVSPSPLEEKRSSR